MNYEQARKFLEKCGQSHVLAFWKELNAASRKALLAEIAQLDAKELSQCAAALGNAAVEVDSSKGLPPKVGELSSSQYEKCMAAGMKELKAGRVAALLVAGGQGSRLGYEGPKGAYPIGPVSGRVLFHFHADKILALSRLSGKAIPWYIMTSEQNDAATKECFKTNGYFGLDKRNVFFFTQGMWPGMTPDGKILMAGKGKLFKSPDGHGGLLSALKRSGALADMKKRGIKTVSFFQVDNPLVEICDPAFVGYHVLNRSEFTQKVVEKRAPGEKIGMPMKFGNKYRMIEYSEMTAAQNNRRAKDGRLFYRFGSPAIHMFDRAFLEREASKAMPIHLAFKKIPFVDARGKLVKPTEPNGYKFEKFIFDILPNAKKVAFLAFEREDEFSPLKNAEGENSPATVRAAISAKARKYLAAIGVTLPEGTSVEFDTAELYR